MKKFKRKSEWRFNLRNGCIPPEHEVELWAFPHSAVCEIGRAAGVPYLVNGTYTVVHSKLAELLLDAGITGTIIVFTTMSIPQNTPNWITWWSSTPFDPESAEVRSLTITTLNQRPSKPLPFTVNTIQPIRVKANDVHQTVVMKSKDDSISMFMVDAGEHGHYKLEPNRTITAKIIDCTPNGYVLRSPTGDVFLTSQVSRRVQGQLVQNWLKPEDIIGTDVRVYYTMYTPGSRLCNYTSALVFRSFVLDNMSGENIPSCIAGFLFNQRRHERSSVLTPTRCERAKIYCTDGVIRGVDTESNTVLYEFRRGVKETGLPCGYFQKGDEIEQWEFVSPYSVDSLDLKGFVRIVESEIYYATGMSLQKLGIHYHDRTAGSNQGENPCTNAIASS